jgi:signal transduction histidine kinase
MKTIKIFFLICIVFNCVLTHAQRPKKIDFKSKIDSINIVSNNFARINQKDSFLVSKKITEKFLKRKNYPFGKSKYFLNTGIYNFNNADFNNALNNFDKSLKLSIEINNINLINSVYSWKLNTLLKLQDSSLNIELNKSLKYLKFNRDTLLQKEDTALLAKRLLFLSRSFRLDSNFSKSLEYIDSSLFYSNAINDTLKIMKALRNKAILLFPSKSKKSLEIFQKIFNYSKKINNPELKIESRFNLGRMFVLKNNLDSAIFYCKSALEIINTTNKKANLRQVLSEISKIYELKEDYKNAFFITKIIESLNEVNTKKLLSNNELEKTNLELKETQTKLKSSTKTSYGVSIILFLFFISLYLYFTNKNTEYLEKKTTDKTKALENIAIQEEKIKQEIGEELHDNIGGSLAALKMRLSQLNDPNYYSSLKKEINNLEDIYNQVRQISSNLSTNPHIKENFLEKIEILCEKTFANSKEIQLEAFPREELIKIFDDKLSNNISNILKEIFANIIKHSQAKTINVSLTKHLEYINLMVSDDGIGFNLKTVKKGRGLKNIKNRAEIFNGEVIIDSKVNFGTTISINLIYKI